MSKENNLPKYVTIPAVVLAAYGLLFSSVSLTNMTLEKVAEANKAEVVELLEKVKFERTAVEDNLARPFNTDNTLEIAQSYFLSKEGMERKKERLAAKVERLTKQESILEKIIDSEYRGIHLRQFFQASSLLELK